MVYIQLMWSFFQVGLFTIGGGYAAIPLIQHQVVEVHSWLTMTQFADIITIAEMTPGPPFINAATFAGIQVAGIPGGILATISCIFPSCMIITILAFFYYRFKGLSSIQGVLYGLRPAVIALISSAGLSLVALSFWGTQEMPVNLDTTDWVSVLFFIAAFFILRRWKVSPLWIIAGTAVSGILLYSFF